MDNKPDIIIDFIQNFAQLVEKILSESLDEEVCPKIELRMESSLEIEDAEKVKDEHIIFKTKYTVGANQSLLVFLLPENLIASIVDILTGGNGHKEYKGTLSEIETNSILSLMEKMLKNIETQFSKKYNHPIAFSTKPELIDSTKKEFSVNSSNFNLDYMVKARLSLDVGVDFDIKILVVAKTVDKIMNDLGLIGENGLPKKEINGIDIKNLTDIDINITAELGRAQVPIKYAMELVRGSLVELDTQNNADIKVFANGVEFARAQVVAVEDSFGLKITKIISPEERMEHI